MRIGRRSLVCGLAGASLFGLRAHAESLLHSRRVRALVVYETYQEFPSFHLNAPQFDGHYIGSRLGEIPNSDVIVLANPTAQGILDALSDAGATRSQRDVVFIYYAGHGIQLKNGDNAILTSSLELLPVSQLVTHITACWQDENEDIPLIVILDACRNNPFASMTSSSPLFSLSDQVATQANGLAFPQVERREVMFVYACAPNAQSPDGGCDRLDRETNFWSMPRRIFDASWLHRGISCRSREGSPFASVLGDHLLDQMSISQITTQVRRTILDFSGEQVPWISSSLTSEIYLNGFPLLSPP